jgi:beta-fructofuranosidase
LSSITSIDAIPDAAGTGTFTIHTMKISPDSRLTRLRQNARESHLDGVALSTSPSQTATLLGTSKWEIDAEFSVGRSCARVGIKILHTSGKSLILILRLHRIYTDTRSSRWSRLYDTFLGSTK